VGHWQTTSACVSLGSWLPECPTSTLTRCGRRFPFSTEVDRGPSVLTPTRDDDDGERGTLPLHLPLDRSMEREDERSCPGERAEAGLAEAGGAPGPEEPQHPHSKGHVHHLRLRPLQGVLSYTYPSRVIVLLPPRLSPPQPSALQRSCYVTHPRCSSRKTTAPRSPRRWAHWARPRGRRPRCAIPRTLRHTQTLLCHSNSTL